MSHKTKDKLIEAAWSLLEELGPQAVTMRAVASRLGVTTPALYKHIESQETLLEALRARGWQQFGAALFEGLSAPEPDTRLTAIGERYLAYGLEHPQVYRLLFMDQPTAPPLAGATHPGPSFQILHDRVLEARAAGSIDSEHDPYVVTILLWSVVHGLVSLYVGGGASRALSLDAYRALAASALQTQLAALRPKR